MKTIHYSCRRVAILVAGLLFFTAVSQDPSSSAQEPDPAQAGTPAAAAGGEKTEAGGVREALTEIIYLRDSEGNLVPVANLSLEEWDQIYKARRNLLGRKLPPAFAIDEVTYQGVVEGNHLLLDVDISLRIVERQQQDEWIAVPVGYHQAVLAKGAGHEGPGDFFLTLDKDGAGHLCWFKAEKGSRHSVSLKLIAPLEKNNRQARFLLTCPPARSRMTSLKVGAAGVESLSDDLRVVSKPAGEQETEFSFDFAGGQLDFSWGTIDRDAMKPVTRLLASTTTRFSIKGPQQVSMHADLTVTGSGGEVSSFEVVLPPSMQVVDLPQGDFRLTVLPAPDGTPQNNVQRVQLTANRPAEELQVTLEAIFRPEPSTPDGESDERTSIGDAPFIPFQGVEVVNAVKQSGFIDFVVDGNWSLNWRQDGDVRRVDEIPDSLVQLEGVARFEFFSQSYALSTRIQPEKTRVRVEPRYLVHVGDEELQLETTLMCQVRGESGFVLETGLDGWTLDQVLSRPADLIDVDSIRENGGLLSIPILAASGSLPGQFEIQFRAHRSIVLAGAEIESEEIIDVPRPTADPLSTSTVFSFLPGRLIVSPDDNVEMLPQLEKIMGLTQEARLTEEEARLLPQRQQVPLVYRDRGDVAAPSFVTRLRVRQRDTTVASLSRVVVDEQQVQLRQELRYGVAYEPIKQLLLEVPSSLVIRRDLQVYLLPSDATSMETSGEGEVQLESLPWAEATEESAGDRDLRRVIRVDLLQDRIGQFRILLRYNVGLPTLLVDQPVTIPVGLIIPYRDSATTFQDNHVELVVDTMVQASPREESWQRDDGPTGRLPQSVDPVFVATEMTDSLPLLLSLNRLGASATTQLHQLWLQTYLTETVRYERAALRVSTSERRLQIQLPNLAQQNTSNLRISIDQQPLAPGNVVINEQGALEIQLPSARQTDEMVIEIWYWTEPGNHLTGSVSVDPPRVTGASSADRIFWQVVMPGNEHLLGVPDHMTPEQEWLWNGWSWRRKAYMDQQDLELWIDASVQQAVPVQTNQYLFTTIGPVRTFTVQTVRRSSLVLVVSGMTLLVGLLLIYFPGIRHPSLLFVAGIGLTASAASWPEIVLLVVQAALLGGGLVGLARLLQWVLLWRLHPGSRLLGRTTAAVDGINERDIISLESGSRGSTASVPMSLEMSSATEHPT
ncbi:MAG: hypothetical protein VYB09_05635 [Planctomycetota bacterium]|nr:hypothetical protein [Planctomycetota bacterium]